MLLLVVEADLQQRHQGRQFVLIGFVKKFHHGGVDVAAIGGDFVRAGAS